MTMAEPLVTFEGVGKTFAPRSSVFGKGSPVHAVRDLTLSVGAGETLGLVGESGSGKTTTGRMLTLLERPTHGRILFEGNDILGFNRSGRRRFRSHVQMIFQDSSQSLDPRLTIGQLVQEPLVALGVGDRRTRRDRTRETLSQVGLEPGAYFDRYPGELSGGQRQRVAIARALVVDPQLIVCDEPVTALDLSVQAQILNLLLDLQQKRNLAYLFIAHDMSVVKQLAHRVAVMYQGELVEVARAAEFFSSPAHPYSVALLEASLNASDTETVRSPRLRGIDNTVEATGCVLSPRCWKAESECVETRPPLAKVSPLQAAACFFPEGYERDEPSGSATNPKRAAS